MLQLKKDPILVFASTLIAIEVLLAVIYQMTIGEQWNYYQWDYSGHTSIGVTAIKRGQFAHLLVNASIA